MIYFKNKFNFEKYIFVGCSGIGTKTNLIKRIKEGKFVDLNEENKEIYEKIIYKNYNKEFILYLIDSDL